MENASQASKGKRSYHSRARQRQAEETRQRILAATRELFASRGYAGTTNMNPHSNAEYIASKEGYRSQS